MDIYKLNLFFFFFWKRESIFENWKVLQKTTLYSIWSFSITKTQDANFVSRKILMTQWASYLLIISHASCTCYIDECPQKCFWLKSQECLHCVIGELRSGTAAVALGFTDQFWNFDHGDKGPTSCCFVLFRAS